MSKVEFTEAKRRLIQALEEGTYNHQARSQIEVKNLLQMGQVTTSELIETIKTCRGQDHESSPHHLAHNIDVHILKCGGWYIKFYFDDPSTVFISVHQ